MATFAARPRVQPLLARLLAGGQTGSLGLPLAAPDLLLGTPGPRQLGLVDEQITAIANMIYINIFLISIQFLVPHNFLGMIVIQ